MRNGVQNGISMLTALESLSRASWSAPGALRSRKKDVGSGSWAAERRRKTRFRPNKVLDLGSTGNGKRIVLQSKDQTKFFRLAGGSIEYRFDLIAVLYHPVPASK